MRIEELKLLMILVITLIVIMIVIIEGLWAKNYVLTDILDVFSFVLKSG